MHLPPVLLSALQGPGALRTFISDLSKMLSDTGMRVTQPSPPVLYAQQNESYEQFLLRGHAAALQSVRGAKRVDILLVLKGGKDKDDYKEVGGWGGWLCVLCVLRGGGVRARARARWEADPRESLLGIALLWEAGDRVRRKSAAVDGVPCVNIVTVAVAEAAVGRGVDQ